MRKQLYEPVSKRKRMSLFRTASLECSAAGFPGFAEVNREMSELLAAELADRRPARRA